MTANKQKIKSLLEAFHSKRKKTFNPATKAEIESFKKKAQEKKVPESVINQLVEFYETSNGVPCVDSLDFHSCNDETLYEWWGDRQLWLAQKDFYTIRWNNEKFCLGDANNVSFGKNYEFEFLSDLLEKAFEEWGYK